MYCDLWISKFKIRYLGSKGKSIKVRSRACAGMRPGAKNKIVYEHVTVKRWRKRARLHIYSNDWLIYISNFGEMPRNNIFQQCHSGQDLQILSKNYEAFLSFEIIEMSFNMPIKGISWLQKVRGKFKWFELYLHWLRRYRWLMIFGKSFGKFGHSEWQTYFNFIFFFISDYNSKLWI